MWSEQLEFNVAAEVNAGEGLDKDAGLQIVIILYLCPGDATLPLFQLHTANDSLVISHVFC